MASVIVVLVCVSLPVILSYGGGKKLEANGQPLIRRTAQNVHLRRRLQHAACGISIAASYKWVIRDAWTVVAWLSLGSACFLALHQLRRRVKRVDDLYLRLVGPLLRPHEIRGLPGAFWFMLGAAVTVALFPRDVALQSILHLSVGDPVASMVGIRMGDRNRVLPEGKSLSGSLAAFMACATVTLFLFGWCLDEETPGCDDPRSYAHLSTTSDHSSSSSSSSSQILDAFWDGTVRSDVSDASLMLIAILGGFSGAVGEALPLGVDDNLSMPLVSGAIFLTLQKYIH